MESLDVGVTPDIPESDRARLPNPSSRRMRSHHAIFIDDYLIAGESIISMEFSEKLTGCQQFLCVIKNALQSFLPNYVKYWFFHAAGADA